MSTHKKIFVNPFHTKKVFANMKRPGKDFSGRITPLFNTMMVHPVEEMEKAKDAQAKEIAALKKRIRRLERKRMLRPIGLKRLKKVDLDKDDDVTLVDETQDRHDDDLMFDTKVLNADEMPMEATIYKKDKQSTKPDDSTAGEAVTTARVEGSVAPTTIKEITLA
ncbi:hypothetical protein Tco_1224843 [Tanacetum coccineum]